MGAVSGLSLASQLACAHSSADSGFFLMGWHLSAKVDSSAKVSGGLAGHLLGWRLLPPLSLPRLKTSSAHASGWEIPLTTRTRKLWSLCLSPNQGPMLLLVSCLEASAGDQSQLLSLGPICLLAHTHQPTLPSGFPERSALSCIVTLKKRTVQMTIHSTVQRTVQNL